MNAVACPLPDRLQTQRLLLRAPCAADAHLLFDAYTQDSEVARYMIWRPHVDVAETEAFIAACLEGWSAGLRRPYVLAFHGNARQPIGMLEARLQGHTVDIGYVLARMHWGQGLMPEAIRGLADATLALPRFFRIQATCDVENRPSARALEKAGFKLEGKLARYMVHPNIDPAPRDSFMYARSR